MIHWHLLCCNKNSTVSLFHLIPPIKLGLGSFIYPDGDRFMARGIDIIILDEEPIICESISTILRGFYTWGDIYSFTRIDEAISHVFLRDVCIGIFIVDVYLEERNGFQFLEAIKTKNPMVCNDAVMMTENASDAVVDKCLASRINNLLEKPIKPYELQFTIRSVIEKYVRVAKEVYEIPDPILLSRFDTSVKYPEFGLASHG